MTATVTRFLPSHTREASTCWKFTLTLCIFSFLVLALGDLRATLPAGWLVTAGKMRDFWGQMCFHSTIIMPLKILIALAVFLGVPGPGRCRYEFLQQLKEERKVFPRLCHSSSGSPGDLPSLGSDWDHER